MKLSEIFKSLPTVPASIFRIYLLILSLITNCSKAKSILILSIEKCPNTCDDPTKCAEKTCALAKQIRDTFVFIDKELSKSKFFRPLRLSVEKQLDDWDDFVIDCEISSDKEIHVLVEKIADAA